MCQSLVAALFQVCIHCLQCTLANLFCICTPWFSVSLCFQTSLAPGLFHESPWFIVNESGAVKLPMCCWLSVCFASCTCVWLCFSICCLVGGMGQWAESRFCFDWCCYQSPWWYFQPYLGKGDLFRPIYLPLRLNFWLRLGAMSRAPFMDIFNIV